MKAISVYENYLRTPELLALQKTSAEQVHHDELLFQIVHQASELWLKLAWTEIELAAQHLSEGEIVSVLPLLERAKISLDYVVIHLDILRQIQPADFQEIRKVLDGGSGFNSPGWKALGLAMRAIEVGFNTTMRNLRLYVVDLYAQDTKHSALYKVMLGMLDLDEKVASWRTNHYKLIVYMIGTSGVGMAGTPITALEQLTQKRFFPELWSVCSVLQRK